MTPEQIAATHPPVDQPPAPATDGRRARRLAEDRARRLAEDRAHQVAEDR